MNHGTWHFRNLTIKRLICLLLLIVNLCVPLVTSPNSAPVLELTTTAEAAYYTYTYYSKCSLWAVSLTDALKSVGADASYSNCKYNIAPLNGISSSEYRGTAMQNIKLLNLLKQGKLVKSKTLVGDTGVTYYPQCSSGYSSLTDALKSVGADASYSNCKYNIAPLNGISSSEYRGTATQNIKLLNLLKQGKLVKSKSTSSSSAPVASTLSFSAGKCSPGTLTQGQSYSISGIIKSNYRITSVTVGIYNANGNGVSTKGASPNATSYNINALDNYITFGKLGTGTYSFKVWAKDASGTSKTLCNNTFKVVQKNVASTLSFSAGRCSPGTLTQGQGYSISGTVKSNYKITSVTVGIYNTSGNGVSTRSASPNTTSYNINALDNYIKFGTLGVGTYTFKVWAKDASGTSKTLCNNTFKVEKKTTPSNNYSTTANKTHELQGSQMCVMSSISMLIRSKLYLQGKSYSHINQWTVRNTYNKGRLTAYWGDICNNANARSGVSGMTYMSGLGNADKNKQKVIDLLKSRPEGVVVHFYANGGKSQHAVRFCNYSNGTFYVSDPANNSYKYVALDNSHIRRGGYSWGSNYWRYVNIIVYYR